MQPQTSHAVTEVESALASLADTLPEDQQAALQRNVALLHRLIAPEPEFSVQAFIASEVADAMRD